MKTMTMTMKMSEVSDEAAGAAVPAQAARVRWALVGVSLSMLMASLDTSIANIGLPALAEAFGASFQEVQWVVLAYLLAITSLIVSAGRLGDIIGRKRLFLGGIGLFTVASLACGIAPTLGVLVAARAAQGLGAAVMIALTMALLGETVTKARTGSAMGLLGTMSAIGTTLGPTLGGFLINGFGWRVIFLINVPLGVLNLLIARRTLPEDRAVAKAARKGFDAVGTGLLALSLAAYGLSMTTGRGSFGPRNLAPLLLALFGIVLFALVQARVESPVIRLRMFRNRTLSTGLAMSVVVSTVMMATLVVGPFYLTRALGLDPVHVGLAMSVGPLVAALAGVPAGRIVDRFGAGRMTTTGLAGLAAGLVALATAPGKFGVAGYLVAIVVVTADYALFQAANNTAVTRDLRQEERGVVSGLLSLSRNLGLITGASAMGALFRYGSGAADIANASPEAVATGMSVTFAFSAALIVGVLGAATLTVTARVSAPAASMPTADSHERICADCLSPRHQPR